MTQEATRQDKITLEDVEIFGIPKAVKYGEKRSSIGIFLKGEHLKVARRNNWTIRTFVNDRRRRFIKASFDNENLQLPSARNITYDVFVYGFEWKVNDKSGVKLYTSGYKPHTQGE